MWAASYIACALLRVCCLLWCCTLCAHQTGRGFSRRPADARFALFIELPFLFSFYVMRDAFSSSERGAPALCVRARSLLRLGSFPRAHTPLGPCSDLKAVRSEQDAVALLDAVGHAARPKIKVRVARLGPGLALRRLALAVAPLPPLELHPRRARRRLPARLPRVPGGASIRNMDNHGRGRSVGSSS